MKLTKQKERNHMNNFEKVSAAIGSDPELLNRIFEAVAPAEAPTRSMPWMNEPKENTELKKILGQDVSEQDINDVLNELNDNQIVQLYRQSEGAIDPKELMEFAGDLSASKAKDNPGVRALFDGKLQLKEIILIILLLKLFKKKQQAQTSYGGYSSNNLLNSLLGTNQQSTTNSLFNSLFGNGLGTTNYGYFTTPSTNSNSLLNLFGLGNTSNYNYNNSYGLLNSFLGGNNLNSSQQSLYNILNQGSSNAVYGSGQVGVNSLFSILSTLLGGR